MNIGIAVVRGSWTLDNPKQEKSRTIPPPKKKTEVMVVLVGRSGVALSNTQAFKMVTGVLEKYVWWGYKVISRIEKENKHLYLPTKL